MNTDDTARSTAQGDDDETRELPVDDRTRPLPTAPNPDTAGDPMNADTTVDTPTVSPDAADPAYRPFPDRSLDEPLPYGAGFVAPQPLGYGVAPEPAPAAGSTEVARRERAGSPVLAVAGLLSLGVAVWAIAGAPAISTALALTAGLVVAVLVGLLMVVRR